MNMRSLIIEAAAELIAQSPSGDVSTRAVCEAAGVQQPVLYRLFGDKDGLLAATVDHVWDQYLETKRAAEKSADPLRDLLAGWDSHVAFALAHPNAYKLMFAPALRTTPEAAREALRILREVLDRLAAQGRMRIAPEIAAQMVMTATTGVALGLITRPELYPDTDLSTSVRDAMVQAILLDTPSDPTAHDARTAAATTLLASLDDLTPEPFTPAESALLGQWLTQIPRSGKDTHHA
ncbi:TetR/AcrR family transcriptional regulator [Streptomyces sp. NPDC050549]|uniref:TetR/AcrR family transcriptional regulator n=1 Tax=Streptomyces sp. NPDC050549 TaxID=3155406 RepID=UPI00341649CA